MTALQRSPPFALLSPDHALLSGAVIQKISPTSLKGRFQVSNIGSWQYFQVTEGAAQPFRE